jgi:4-amino-4-deoxy-L-arabinose transferase-like glycosyltransferase
MRHPVSILFIFLVIKIALFFFFYTQDPSRVLMTDSTGYFGPPAEALFELGRFSKSISLPNSPEILNTPGYPFFLATIYSLFGNINQVPVIILQIFLGGATIILTYVLAKKIWGHKIGVIAGVFLALDPGSFASPFFIMTETLFAFLIIIAVLAGANIIQNQNSKFYWAFTLGLALGLAILVRPIAYYLVPLLGIGFCIYVAVIKHFELKKIAIIGLLIALPLFLFVGGWKIRNFIVAGDSSIAHSKDLILFFYGATEITMKKYGISYDEALAKLNASLPPMEGWSEAQQYDFIGRRGLSIIKENPLLFAEDRLYGLAEMVSMPYETGLFNFLGVPHQAVTYIVRDLFTLHPNQYLNKWAHEYRSQFVLFLIMEAYLLFLYASIVVSIWKAQDTQGHHRIAYLLLGVLILYFLVISESAPRFRIPIMPYLSIFGALGFYCAYNYIRKYKTLN